MRASKRGRGVRVRALQLSLFALSLVPAFTGNGAAADPPPERKTAPSSDADRKKLLAERERFSVESWKHESQGKLTEAIAAAEKMLAIERKVLGDFNDDVVDSLVRLAEMHEAREEFAVARQARQDVLAIRTKLYGEKEWRVTDARLALEQTIRSSQLGAAQRRDLAEAHSLNQEIVRLYEQGQFGKAAQLAAKVLVIRKKVLGEAHPDYADSLNNLAALYMYQGDYAKAEPLFRHAIAIRKKTLGEAHPRYATTLNNLALLYQYQGDYAKAEPLYRQASEIWKEALGKAHPDYAASLDNLASLYVSEGEAEPLFRQALAIRKKALGEAHPIYALSLHNLATLYDSQGDYAKSEPLFRQALAIYKKALREAHPHYASSLNGLAGLYRSQGDYAKAESLYRQALEIRKKILGEAHSDYAGSLSNLASLYVSQGDYAKAEPLYRQAMAIYNKALGEAHRDYASSLNGLAFLYLSQSDYAKAEPLYRQAMEIRRRALGDAHPNYAGSLSHLATLYHLQGNYAKAERLGRQASQIFKKVFGESHPDYAQSLANLSKLYQSQGDNAKAAPLCRQALEIFEKHFANTLRIQSERQQLATANLLRVNLDEYLYLTGTAGGVATAAEAYRHVLGWKGAVFSAQSLPRRARANPELDALFGELMSVSTRLATLSLAVPDPKKREVWLRQIGDLTNRKEDLERDLATKSAEFRQAQETARLTPEQLQRVLPKGTVLVDFLEYTGFNWPGVNKGHVNWVNSVAFSPDGKRIASGSNDQTIKLWDAEKGTELATLGRSQREQRLVAFVVRSGHPIVRVDLGPVQPLVEAADRWRQSILVDPEARSTAPPAKRQTDAKSSTPPERLLRERLWNPLLPHIQGVELVMISPDGFLNQIPLAALPGREAGTYLVEEMQLVTVPVPRELTALLKAGGTNPSASNPSLLVVGNVDFGGDPGLVSLAQRDVALTGDQHRAAVRGSGRSVFDQLPGTAAEIEDVAQLFRATFPEKEIKAFQKSAATEYAFRTEAPRHRWIHLATHGFFAPETVRSGLDRSTDDEQHLHGELFGSASEVRGFHPGLLSGIALAGANGGSHLEAGFNSSSGKEADDGILTALEVTGLDLRNVDLVVLSACETGLGHVAGGEGVLGLQRAFQLAGAKNVVASLWKVDDRATVALMRVFYHKLWVEQKPAAVALREAQLAMLRHSEQIELLATTRGANFAKTVQLVDHGQRASAAQRL
jgi:CHAT domain-containing protein/tetratricopeptide (TPR) repeat protein